MRMNVFALGDLHLDHGLTKPMDVFGTHWANHMSQIEQHWRATVAVEDIVLIPGDISWAMRLKDAQVDLDWLDALPGQKVCIRGNHDYWWNRPTPLNRAYAHTYFLQNTVYALGHIGICGTRGWSLEEKTASLEENKRMIERECIRLKLSLDAAMKQNLKEIWVMLHYPPQDLVGGKSPFIELIKQYPVTKVIYGHLHDTSSWEKALMGVQDGIMYYLTSADFLGFKPLQIGSLE